ncbi:MAG: hypothetical protein RML36_13305 [Anaerolineae bacterium]|nr:hypothetical protein [Anaerolineae bacterium]
MRRLRRIPYEDYLRFQLLQEQEILGRFDSLLAKMAEVNACWSEEEVVHDLAGAKERLDLRRY